MFSHCRRILLYKCVLYVRQDRNAGIVHNIYRGEYKLLSSYKSLSKSRYLNGLQCGKLLWVSANNYSRLPEVDEATQNVFDQGHYVGELAQALFPGGLSVYSMNIGENLRETKAALASRKPLYEAGFSASHLFCRVDILNPSGDAGWDIIEVKSTTEIRDEHLHDVAFQLHCCRQSGLAVERCRIVYLNKDFIKNGELDPRQLFIDEDVTGRLAPFSEGIEERISQMLDIVSCGECPQAAVGQHCNSPYPCALQEECWAYLPEHHVMTLYYGKKLGEDLLSRGILGIGDIPQDVKLNPKQQIQKDCVVCGQPHIDRIGLRSFLDKLKYPLYFMDFETFMTAVPLYDGTSPYQAIPFQFSVHSVEQAGGRAKHKSFLAKGKEDPRPAFLAALKEAVGEVGTVLVYYEAFEKSRLKELAKAFPEYRDWIASVVKRIEDLLEPFKDFSYYHPSQAGSASLKKVMPAVTGVSYDDLEIAHGDIASLRYMQAAFGDVTAAERAKIRRDLLKYCGQDTSGMVRIVENLAQESRRLL